MVELSGDEIQHPLSALNSSGMPVTNPEMTEISIFREPGIGKAPVLGRVLLSKVRTPECNVDLISKNFRF